MRAYKGFNRDLACTKGKGTYSYEVGKTYTEARAQCAQTGFHCVEEPIEVLRWYPEGKYCIVDAQGDIHEDGKGRISCTQLEILKEITRAELCLLECRWMELHPERAYSGLVHRDRYEGRKGDDVIVVRGKHPAASGKRGATLFLLKEYAKTRKIRQIAVYQIDGQEYLPDVLYGADGRRQDG